MNDATRSPRSRRHAAARLLALLLLAAPLALGGCGGESLPSVWLAGEAPVVDGHLDRSEARDEWRGALSYLADAKLHVGALNDGEALYFCLATRDRETQMKMLRQGFTLWFDVEGGEEKAFGLRFPARVAGNSPFGRAGSGGRAVGGRGGDGAERPTPPTLGELLAVQDSVPAEIDVMIAESVAQRIRLAELPGLALAIGEDGGVLNYELRLPFAVPGGSAFALAAAPGDVLGIGGETEAFEMPERPSGGMGGRGGGMGGPGGGMGGPGGGRRGGMAAMSEPIEFWGQFRLAESGETGTP